MASTDRLPATPPMMGGQFNADWLFLLGGHDLEMLTLRSLLDEEDVAYLDRAPAWGAAASVYASDITAALQAGKRVVAVELEDDLPPEQSARLHWIDHHDERAGAERPCSLRQAFELLELDDSRWTRNHQLVAANDIGHIAAMRALGASDEDMRTIRLAEFAVRGVGARQLEQTRQALLDAEQPWADLAIIRLPHNHTGTVTDMADPIFGGQGVMDMLVVGPNELGFFGRGDRVLALWRHYGGWMGGNLPEQGYWGRHGSGGSVDEILAILNP